MHDCPVLLIRYSDIQWPSVCLTSLSLSTKLTGDKKQHEMRLRLKADLEATASKSIGFINRNLKPIFPLAVKKIKKIKPPQEEMSRREPIPVQDIASALMKLGEVCSQEMEHLKSEDSLQPLDSDKEASESGETSDYVSKNENESCASSILAMMSHREKDGSIMVKMQLEERASSDSLAPPSFALPAADVEGCRDLLPPDFQRETQMEFVSYSKTSVDQQAEIGTVKASIHQAIRDDANIGTEQSRTVTPPSLDGKQLLSGWTYYPVPVPKYAFQAGVSWKLRLIPANGREGASIGFDPRTGFPGTDGNASQMQTYQV